jgi:hypothetical protein
MLTGMTVTLTGGATCAFSECPQPVRRAAQTNTTAFAMPDDERSLFIVLCAIQVYKQQESRLP